MVEHDRDSNITKCILDSVDRYYVFFLGLILLLNIFNFFCCLGETPLYSWDEARHGVSAYEMLKRNDFIVNTYGYRNDYWNLKPPLSFWAIMLGYKIVGFNSLGLRFFSASATLFTIIIVALFSKYKHGTTASLIAALVLTLSPNFIVAHSARMGDADAIFVFFFTVSVISLILSIENFKWLYLSGVFFSLGFLTKSWHAANIMLIILAYLFISLDLFKLKLKKLLIFSISSSFIIIVWGIFRYWGDSLVFIGGMISYDLISRSSRPLEGHVGDNLYYFNVLLTHYRIWIVLFLSSTVTYAVIYKDKFINRKFGDDEKKYALAMILWIVVPLVMFTIAKTKIGWYILPLYPPMAICIGGICGELIRGKKSNVIINILILVLLLGGLFYYEDIIYKRILVYKNDLRRVTFQKFKVNKNIKGYKVYIEYNRPIVNDSDKSEFKDWKQSDLLSAELYWNLLPMEGGLKRFLKEKGNDVVMIIKKDKSTLDIIEKYNLKILGESNSVFMLRK